jgi:4-alpha-glucanotransferase
MAAARAAMRARGIALAGDLPFLVGSDSADVWSRQDEFDLAGSVGAPPDAFSAEGQDWGLPGYRWDAIAASGYAWFHARGRRAAELYDWVRVDHVVGLYRTWIKPREGPARFVPEGEPEQLRQGEAVLEALRASGAALVAEDLGVIPPFVRDSLSRLEIPGYRVLRWEIDHGAYRDPATWPVRSVATSGTHDTEPMSVWWDELPEHERRAARQLPRLRDLPDEEVLRFGPRVCTALLESLYGAASSLLIVPIQDLFGARERINQPGTVSDTNWRYRTPFSIEDLHERPELRKRTEELAALAHAHGR